MMREASSLTIAIIIFTIIIFLSVFIWLDFRVWKKKKDQELYPDKKQPIIDDWGLLDSSCTCHCGHPPCSFCVDTFICDGCKERNYSFDVEETEFGFLCETCTDEEFKSEMLKSFIISVILLIKVIALIAIIYLLKS